VNILVLTKEGNLLGLADRFSREGHAIKVFTPTKLSGRGVFETISPPEIPSAVKWCKFVVSDWPQPQSFYEKLAMFNKPIVGASYHTELLNADCIAEYAVMGKLAVFMPKSKVVGEISEIYKILMSWELPRYDIRFGRTWFSGRHKEFMNWAVQKIPPGDMILLQEPIEGDVDVQIIGLFNGQDFIKPFFVSNWENNLGSAVVFPLLDGNQLAVQNLNKLANYFRLVDYKGPVSARLTIRGDQIFCRELFVGFRFPEIYAILENLRAPASSVFHSMAFTMDGTPQVGDRISAAVQVTSDDLKNMHGAPILNMEDPDKLRHLFPGGVMKSDLKANEYFISGESEVIYTAAAYGANIRVIRDRIERTVSNSEFPHMRFDLMLLSQANRLMMVLKDRKYLNAA